MGRGLICWGPNLRRRTGGLRRVREYRDFAEVLDRAGQFLDMQSNTIQVAAVFARDIAAHLFVDQGPVLASL